MDNVLFSENGLNKRAQCHNQIVQFDIFKKKNHKYHFSDLLFSYSFFFQLRNS